MESVLTEKKLGLGGHLVANYYSNKVELDRDEIEKILTSSEPITLNTIIERLHIPPDVLEYHFDNILMDCPEDEKNRVCDKILAVRGEPTKEDQKLAQRLRIEAKKNSEEFLRLKDEFSIEISNLTENVKTLETKNNDLERDIDDLKSKIVEKDGEIKRLTAESEDNKLDQTKFNELLSRFNNVEKERDQVAEQLRTAQNEKDAAGAQIVSLQEKISELESDLKKSNDQLQNQHLHTTPTAEEKEVSDFEKDSSKKKRNIVIAAALGVILVVFSVIFYLYQSSKPQTQAAQSIAPMPIGALPGQTKTELNIPVPQSTPAQMQNKQSPTAPLIDTESFKNHAKEFKINGQSIVFYGATFTVGDDINGFKILSIDTTYFRLQDPVNGVVFRVDVTNVGGN